jgi:succinoglycan biosynthesis protein ExoL
LRCLESFRLLHLLAQRQPNMVEITLRGTPLPEIQKLINLHLPIANMRFNGRYNQSELGDIYGECDFTWGVEYYNRGTNSDWCLPNRIYEGGFYNCPSIAQAGTETATWLQTRGSGVLLREPQVDLEPFFVNLTSEYYRSLRRTCEDVPTSDLVWTAEECQQFLARITIPCFD